MVGLRGRYKDGLKNRKQGSKTGNRKAKRTENNLKAWDSQLACVGITITELSPVIKKACPQAIHLIASYICNTQFHKASKCVKR